MTSILRAVVAVACVVAGLAPRAASAQPEMVNAWNQPFAPFRIVGNVHYVGTNELVGPHEKAKVRAGESSSPFIDPKALGAYVDYWEQQFLARLAGDLRVGRLRTGAPRSRESAPSPRP